MRKIVAFAFIFMAAEFAAAQIPTSGNVFFGYSYFNTNLNGDRNSLNGWEGTVEGKVLLHIAIVADFSGHYRSENFNACNGFDCVLFNTNVSQHNYLFGPRVSASIGKIRPFAEFLIGVACECRHRGVRHIVRYGSRWRVGLSLSPVNCVALSGRLHPHQPVRYAAE